MGRKKRNNNNAGSLRSGYTYVTAELQIQCWSPSGSAADLQAFFDNITDAEGKISNDLKLEVDNCGDPYCRVRRGRPTCSNTYFEDLPAGYEVLTEVGFYQSPTNKSYVDATNLKS